MADSIDQVADTKKKGGKLKYIILLVVLLAVGGGGFAAWQFYFKAKFGHSANATTNQTAEAPKAEGGHGEAPSGEGAAKQSPEEAKNKTLGGGELVTLDPFVVNLSDPNGKRYLKLSLSAELKDKPAVAEFNKAMPMIKDSILLLLSSKAYSDIASMEDKLQLKKELVLRMNQILGAPLVLEVYFAEFVIQ